MSSQSAASTSFFRGVRLIDPEAGVDKVVDSFRDCMNQVQDARKRELQDAGAEIENEQD